MPVGTQILLLIDSHVTLKILTPKFFAQNYSCKNFSKFSHYAAFLINNFNKIKNVAHVFQFFPTLHTPNSPLTISLPSPLIKLYAVTNPSFTRRTSGHSLGTFREVYFPFSPRINVVCLITAPVLSILRTTDMTTHSCRM